MNNIPSQYELINSRSLSGINAKGSILRHKKSGAHIALIENDDDNKVFYIGFRTPPEDSTGVAHIIEHTGLCGSDKYPVKDPFVELVKGSLNTFLNAMTYPDKTVYPVASTNDKDFANLMDVYLDAVFHPNIYKTKKIFMQEGWHYELSDKDDELTINGVVYNEMKGAFSSPDDVLSREIFNSLFPDTPYGVESGGDPRNIPDLTYENYIAFHQRYYHPSNSYIYLYGDMDMEERLIYLDREYLSHYDAIDPDSNIPMQKPFDEVRRIRKEYPIASEESPQKNTYLSYNIVTGTSLSDELYQALGVLDYAIIGAPGSPLRKALLDAGIGMDIMGGYDAGTLQPMFSVIAKGAEEEDEERFVQIIRDTLNDQVKNGIDKKALLAGINGALFQFREADFGSYPKGLIYGLQALDSWLYDDEAPFMHLEADRVLGELRSKVDTDYFEKLLQKYLIDNTHASIVTVCPKQGLTAIEDAKLKDELAAKKAKLSAEEIDRIVKDTAELKAYQSEPSTPEELLTIPMLERSDLKRTVRPFHNDEKNIDGVTVVHHNVFSHGIHYLGLVFDATDMPYDVISALSLMIRMIGYLDTDKHDYIDLANEVNLHTGGISATFNTYRKIDDTTKYTLEYRAKFLYEEYEEAMDLLTEILTGTQFTDKKRMRELCDMEVSRMSMVLQQAGHSAAAIRAAASFSTESAVRDRNVGIAYYRYIKDLSEHFDEKINGFIDQCNAFLKKLVRSDNMLVSSTGDDTVIDELNAKLPVIIDAVNEMQGKLKGEDIRSTGGEALFAGNYGLKTAGQVQYVAMAGNYKDAGYEYSGTMQILKVALNYDYLWNNIRVLGGAYGCASVFMRSGTAQFTSYRDPNLKETVDVFKKTADFLENFDATERDLTKYIIGTISNLDTPLTPSQDGIRSLNAYFTGITEELLTKERIEILEATNEDIRALAKPVRAVTDQDHICVVGNEDRIEECADVFDHREQLL